MKNNVKKSLFIVALISTCFCASAETMYVLSGKCNVPLKAGMNSATYQLFTYDGTNSNVTTDISCNLTNNTAGFYYNSTSLSLSDLKNTSNYGTSSSSNRTMQAFKLAGSSTLTITLGSKTMSKAIVIGRANSTDALTIDVFGQSKSTNNKDIFVMEIEQSFSGSMTINNETSKEFNFFIYLIEGQAVTPTVNSVTVSPASATLDINDTQQLTATVSVTPSTADNTVTWTSNNPSVATVSATGLVTAVSQGTATITATSNLDNTKSGTCSVTVNAPAVEKPVTAISIKSATTIKVGASETLTVTYTPTDANTGKAVNWTSSAAGIASVDASGKVSGVAAGTAVITATSTTNPAITATCNVTIEENTTPPPTTDLTTHTPEIYEDPTGYNTPLVQYQGREYEVYYAKKGKINGSSCAVVITKAGDDFISDASQKAKDGWFETDAASYEESGGSAKEEFKIASGSWKMKDNKSLTMHIKGYDQFRFLSKENKAGQEFEIYIDGAKQNTSIQTSIGVRGFDISTGEHVIKVVAIGGSNIYFYGWSLRVTNDPIVRHINGPKEQTVYQTKEIQRVAYRVRRAASYRLTWVGNTINGVALSDGTNDSVYVTGIANVAAGTYTYRLEALDNAGMVKSYEQGSITIEPHIFDAAKGNDFTTNIAEPIKPLNFLYYASNNSDIQLNCDIQGLSLTYDHDSIAVLSGTPALATAEGEHTYSITAVGGNTITGAITIVVPNPYFEPIAEAKGKDGQPLSFALIAHHATNVTATGLPTGFTVNYDATKDIATISGTPNVGAPYPKSFEFTATATPRYAGKSSVTVTGKLTIIDPNAKTILVVCKGHTEVSEEPVAQYLQTQQYDITLRQQEMLAGSSYEAFNLILISESVDANNSEVLAIARGEAGLPVLNMKSFSYSPGRLNWGEPDNGTLDTLPTTQNRYNIFVQRADHPIFKALGWKQGDRKAILSNIDRKGLMPVNVDYDGTLCLATAYTRSIQDYYKDGELQTFLHEVPASMRNGKKYLCLPIAYSSCQYLNKDGKDLLKAAIDYLTSNEATVALPELEITRFAIGDIAGEINQMDNTILVEINEKEHPDLDLAALKPAITLKDQTLTHVSPASGEEENFSSSIYVPIEYVVSDYINRRVYEVTVRKYSPQGIDEVYTDGEWVNVYDIYGRLLTTTNENIYTMDLPRGMYLIVTSGGQTIKLMK